MAEVDGENGEAQRERCGPDQQVGERYSDSLGRTQKTWPAMQDSCRASSHPVGASATVEPAATSTHYLKWGFVEAATCAVRLKAYPDSHIGRLYQRLQPAKGHGRAIVAVARHLAEASFWVLGKQQPYKPPATKQV